MHISAPFTSLGKLSWLMWSLEKQQMCVYLHSIAQNCDRICRFYCNSHTGLLHCFVLSTIILSTGTFELSYRSWVSGNSLLWIILHTWWLFDDNLFSYDSSKCQTRKLPPSHACYITSACDIRNPNPIWTITLYVIVHNIICYGS